jgi:hypothetical protein
LYLQAARKKLTIQENAPTVAHGYAVQESDTTMLIRIEMLTSKSSKPMLD